MTEEEARARLTHARSATLGTVGPDQQPHLVPFCFAVEGNLIFSVVDGKPKSTTALRRLDNVRSDPAATVLADHFEEDWTQLWWVRADGRAEIHQSGPLHQRAIGLLADKYTQYREARPSGAVLAITIDRWRSWSAS